MIRKQTLINAIDATINRIDALMPTNKPYYDNDALTIVDTLEGHKRTLKQLKDTVMSSRQAIVDEIETLQGEHREKIQDDLEQDDKDTKKEIKNVNTDIDKIQGLWYLVDGVLKKRVINCKY